MYWRFNILIGLAICLFCSGCVYRPISLQELFYQKKETGPPEQSFKSETPRASLAINRPRIKTALRPLPEPQVVDTPEVRAQLNRYTGKHRSFIVSSLENRDRYYPLLAEILSDEGVPLELMNVALIESRFRPTARSRSGAVGMWQFMKGTGRLYGLESGMFSDQRKDPVLSTIAAARHLRDLYTAYEDWNLALAAYNAGSGRVDRAINRGKTRDFWELSRRRLLPAQTRNYVPKFLATTLIVHDLERYGFDELAGRLTHYKPKVPRKIRG